MYNNWKGLKIATVITISMVLLPLAKVQAQKQTDQDIQTFSLEDTVVTATRIPKTMINTPANAQIITAKQIKDGGYSSVFEAVKALAQANAYSYQDDGSDYGAMMSRIKLRGIDDGTLVLINGNPCNYMNHASLSNIPIDQVERIEIVKGANSVLYGPQAMGGVINIITKKPVKTSKISGKVSVTAGSRLEGSAINVQTDVFDLGIKKTISDDFFDVEHPGTTGSGKALNIKDKSSEQMYFDANLAKHLNFSYGHTNSKAKYETGSFTDYIANMKYLSNIETTNNNYTLVYDDQDTGIKAVAGYNTYNSSTIYDKSYPSHYTDVKYFGYNANFDVQKKLDLRNDKDSLIIGANYAREALKYTKSAAAVTTKNNRDSYSLYQSYDWQATDKLSFIFGAREYHVTSSQYQSSDTQILPQIQGLYKVNDKSSYYFNVGKSFEMPSMSSGFSYNSNFVINSDLKPQSGWSYEIGHKLEDDHKAITTDVFYMTVNDKFYWDKTDSGASIMRNHDKWKNMGLEFNYKQKINKNLSTDIGFTIQNPKAYSNDDDRWTQDSAKYVINWGANYNKDKFMADARIFAYLDREPAHYKYNRKRAGSSPDHNLKNSCDFTLTLQYKPTDVDCFKVVGRNLFNRDDVINNYEYYALPANVTFTYERSF